MLPLDYLCYNHTFNHLMTLASPANPVLSIVLISHALDRLYWIATRRHIRLLRNSMVSTLPFPYQMSSF
jgi:hypothetical protein